MAFEIKEQLSPKQKDKKAKEMIQWLRANGYAHLLIESQEECGPTNTEA
jgi:hypothetical protein